MNRKKRNTEQAEENYLERIPTHAPDAVWREDAFGRVTFERRNRGLIHHVTRILFEGPKSTSVHLDRVGGFVWQSMDGVRSVGAIGEAMEAEFGERIQPTYERLVFFLEMLDRQGWIRWK